jgi:hypothetical protein
MLHETTAVVNTPLHDNTIDDEPDVTLKLGYRRTRFVVTFATCCPFPYPCRYKDES